MNNKIVILAGFSSSGKDTLALKLKDLGYNFITSTTSRPIREGESDKNPYHFVSKEDFLKMISKSDLIEHRSYNTLLDGVSDTWYYGVSKKEVQEDKHYVAVLDIVGLRAFKKQFPDRTVGIFINVPHEVREERAMSRGSFDKTEWDRRLLDDLKLFPQNVIENEVDFVVDNVTLEQTLKDILSKI